MRRKGLLRAGVGVVGIFLVWGFFFQKNQDTAPWTLKGNLAKFEQTMIGDNNRISALLTLFGGYANIALKTDEPPYGLTINYFDAAKGMNVGLEFTSEEERNQLFLQRASMLFILVPNLEKILMTYDGDSVFSVSRKYLETILETKFSDYETNAQQWEGILKEKIENSEVKKGISESITHFPQEMMSQEFSS